MPYVSTKSRVLLLTPITPEFTAVRSLIAAALDKAGIEAIAWDAEHSPIGRAMEHADLIIADVTGANPSVMYELGLAHGLRIPVLPIVARRAGSVPPEVAGLLFLVYDSARPEELQRNIQEWAVRYLKQHQRI